MSEFIGHEILDHASSEELVDLKRAINAHGLELEAIENFDPAHWHDVLLDGPKRAKQIEQLKQIIRDVGRVGIPIFGYYFSLAGVWGQSLAPIGRWFGEVKGYRALPNARVPVF